jgi:hypothetical protein
LIKGFQQATREMNGSGQVASDAGPMELMKGFVVRGCVSGEDPSNVTGD